jgi:rRNA maturation RNase YbeY
MSTLVNIKNLTKRPTPSLPFQLAKDEILGEDFELSLVFAGDALTHKLNISYRDKDKPANVLSFLLSKQDGEIFLNLSKCENDEEVLFLFIHGLLHLKGLDHGSIMDARQEKIIQKISETNNGENYSNRNRRRNIRSKGSGF